jgi:hypothetical protein
VAPAFREHNVAVSLQRLEAGIAVDVEHALEVRQMGSWHADSKN